MTALGLSARWLSVTCLYICSPLSVFMLIFLILSEIQLFFRHIANSDSVLFVVWEPLRPLTTYFSYFLP